MFGTVGTIKIAATVSVVGVSQSGDLQYWLHSTMQDFERAMWNENGNAELFDEGTQAVLKALVDAGQGHLFEKWPGKGQDDEEKMRSKIYRIDMPSAGLYRAAAE